MASTKHRSRIKRIIKIIFLSLTGLIILSGISAYFLLHTYINKMKLINSDIPDTVVSEAETSIPFEEKAADIDEDSVTGEAIESFSAESKSVGLSIEDPAEEVISAKGAISSKSNACNEVNEVREVNKQDKSEKEINLLDETISENLEGDTSLMEDEKVINILLIGSDTRNSEKRGRSDSMILVTVNQKNKKIIATSFLRDIYLQIPGKENNRLNAAYAKGGADLLLETLQKNFKFKIDKYIIVDFFVFIDIVDEIGGVTMKISENELEIINQYIMEINTLLGEDLKTDCLTEAGTILLNGKQALGYSRNRYTSKGDFDRTGRQREVLIAIYEKIKKQNLLKMNDFLNVILPQITTNFTENEILAQILKLSDYFKYGFEEWSVPISGTYRNLNVNGMAVLGIDFKRNITEIYQKLYNK